MNIDRSFGIPSFWKYNISCLEINYTSHFLCVRCRQSFWGWTKSYKYVFWENIWLCNNNTTRQKSRARITLVTEKSTRDFSDLDLSTDIKYLSCRLWFWFMPLNNELSETRHPARSVFKARCLQVQWHLTI